MSFTQSEMVIFDQPHIARNRFKIAIVGSAHVGKSALARRLVHNKFDQHQQETSPPPPTIQAVQLRICDGYVAKIEIIDIGQYHQ
jgi:GTPase SAR1 family protein